MEPEHEASPIIENDRPAAPPAGRTSLRRLACHAAAVGMLVGLAEVWWSYKMPDFDESWRAVLPASLGGLALFTLTLHGRVGCLWTVGPARTPWQKGTNAPRIATFGGADRSQFGAGRFLP